MSGSAQKNLVHAVPDGGESYDRSVCIHLVTLPESDGRTD